MDSQGNAAQEDSRREEKQVHYYAMFTSQSYTLVMLITQLFAYLQYNMPKYSSIITQIQSPCGGEDGRRSSPKYRAI